MDNKMRKGFTVVELVIVVLVVGLIVLTGYSVINRHLVDYRCVKAGYVKASKNSFNSYCTRVENGNTVVIHSDSLR